MLVGKWPIKVPNLKSLRLFCHLGISTWTAFYQSAQYWKWDLLQGRQIQFAGVCVCSFQPGGLTGWGSEGVKPRLFPHKFWSDRHHTVLTGGIPNELGLILHSDYENWLPLTSASVDISCRQWTSTITYWRYCSESTRHSITYWRYCSESTRHSLRRYVSTREEDTAATLSVVRAEY